MAKARRPFISALILAAGASRRMGQPKLLLPWRGRALLQSVVDHAAAARVDEMAIVIAPDSPLPDVVLLPAMPPARWVINENAAGGQASSLAAGLGALDARAAAAAILLGDQPGVDAALIDRVLEAFARGDRPAARPIFRGSGAPLPGHPVVLARALWSRLQGESGDRGARDLLRGAPELLLEVPIDGVAPADIDTLADYRRWRDD